MIGVCIHQQVASCESPVSFQKAGIDMLKTAAPSLPDEGRTAILEPGHPDIFLVASGQLVDSKNSKRTGKIAGNAPGAYPETVAIGHIILPDQITAVGPDGDLGENLVARQWAGDRIFFPLGSIRVLRHNSRGDSRQKRQENKPLPGARR